MFFKFKIHVILNLSMKNIFPKQFYISDVFVLKRKKEEDVKRNLLNNPMKMKRLQKQVQTISLQKTLMDYLPLIMKLQNVGRIIAKFFTFSLSDIFIIEIYSS